MFYNGGLGFKLPLKMLILQCLLASTIFYLMMPAKAQQVITRQAILEVDNFVNDVPAFPYDPDPPHAGVWETNGSDPYLNGTTSDQPTNEIYNTLNAHAGSAQINFENITSPATKTYINATVFFNNNISAGFEYFIALSNGTFYLLKQQGQTSGFETFNETVTNWFSNLQQINNMTIWLGHGTTFTIGIHIDYFYIEVFYTEPPPPFNFINEYFGLGLFLAGIVMMIYAPSWVAWKIKKSGVTPDTVERAGYAMLIFLMGFGLFITFIYD